MPVIWQILTGEYPPGCGGVGDYTAALADALAATGDIVHVWTPAPAGPQSRSGVAVHRLPDAFGPESRREMERAWREQPGVVLLQYVPNALGSKGANLAFCRWFSRLRPAIADVRVMFHEPYFYFTWRRPWAATNGLAVVQRLMARLLLRGATRVYYSTDTWSRYLPSDRAETLPIPSNIPAANGHGSHTDAAVGHFGTYGAHVAAELSEILPALVARVPKLRIALLGAGGPAFLADLSRTHPAVAACASAPGRLEATAVASALRACDVLLQPYPDGITTRRTSAMAGLRSGVATVTSIGPLTEPVWVDTGAVALAPAGDVPAFVAAAEALLRDASARDALGRRAAAAYASRFSMEHTIAILKGAAAR